VLARSHSPSAHRLGHHQHQQQPQLQQQRWPRDHVYRRKADGRTEKLVLVLVGLPARGKSYIAHKLVNYLNWTGRRARLFNVGAFRRLASSSSSSPAADSSPEAAATGADGGDGASSTAKSGMRHDSEFFSHANARARALRDELAFTVLQELCQWLGNIHPLRAEACVMFVCLRGPSCLTHTHTHTHNTQHHRTRIIAHARALTQSLARVQMAKEMWRYSMQQIQPRSDGVVCSSGAERTAERSTSYSSRFFRAPLRASQRVSVHCDVAHTTATFLQSICDDRQVLESNFLQKIRNSPDYRNMPEEEAVKVWFTTTCATLSDFC
jgi:hypothetical protein